MRLLALSLFALTLAGGLAAQTWQVIGSATAPATTPPAIGLSEMVYDVARGRSVLFGGFDSTLGGAVFNETWEYDGTSWGQRTLGTSPPARGGFGMAYDTCRGRTVVFGGGDWGGSVPNQTWEYDGTNWTQVATAISPPPRMYNEMVYDSARGVCVMFGGALTSGATVVANLNDTWEYDGTNWTQVTSAASPPGMSYFAMAYDPVRGRTVVWDGFLTSVWEYDGANWVQVTMWNIPTPRIGPEMSWDGSRIVEFGVLLSFTPPYGTGDCWVYTPTSWIDITAATGAAQIAYREYQSMCYDSVRGKVVMYGGGIRETAELGGKIAVGPGAWRRITTVFSPPATNFGEMTFDGARGRAVLFGGLAPSLGGAPRNETWEYDGAGWILVTTASAPPARSQFAMAHDINRGRTVVFGGLGPSFSPRGDTWEYSGLNWTKMSTAGSPQARYGCQMVCDSVRGMCVLFGGGDGVLVPGTYYTDTWEWDGTSWTQVTTAAAPPGRKWGGMSYDPARGRTILFGGFDALGTALNDTWEYDGANWVQIVTANSPPPRGHLDMTHDWTTGETILCGGYDSNNNSRNDCWAFDGTDWTDISAITGSGQLTGRYSQAMCYDTVRKLVVLYGGNPDLRETWELSRAWPWTPFGTGCAGSAGVPGLTLTGCSVPALGSTFSLEIVNLPPSPGAAYMITGFSDTVWNGTPLPWSLSSVGMPACNLNVAPDPSLTAMFLHGGSTFTWSKSIPNVPALQGVQFFNQVMSIDPAAPNGKAAFSNAGRGVVQ